MSLEQASGEESVSNAHNHKRTGGKSLIFNQIKQWLIDLKEIIIVFFLAIWIMTFLMSKPNRNNPQDIEDLRGTELKR